LQINGFFVHWERKIFQKHKGLLDEINCFHDIRENNNIREGLNLSNFDSFFYLLIFGLFISILFYFYEQLIIHRLGIHEKVEQFIYKNDICRKISSTKYSLQANGKNL
jgi:hypothetical protein